MAKVKTQTINVNKKGIKGKLTVTINVDKEGIFKCKIPADLFHAAKSVFGNVSVDWLRGERVYWVSTKTLDELEHNLYQSLLTQLTVNSKQEHVIQYTIKTRISFAQDKNGTIYPNASFPDAEWADGEKYSNDNHILHERKGYAIEIGAKVMTKITSQYGNTKKVSYEAYNGDNNDEQNPAALLNAWTSFDLGNDPKEIPYSNDAALFFHRLMLGMAELSALIQKYTFEQSDLLNCIAANKCLLLDQQQETPVDHDRS